MHITDTHLFAEADGSLRGTNTNTTLTAVLQHLRAARWPAELIAMTGDLIQDDTRGAYQNFCQHFGSLGLPVLCVPGNHDIRNLMREALSAAPYRYCGTHRQHDWFIVGIDSCKKGSAGGAVSAAELDRLRNLVENTDAQHVLVCLHHPPLLVGTAWLDTVGLENGEAFLDALAAMKKVRGCLFGHVHQNFDHVHDGMRILGTPSTCRQFLPGSDNFALDDRPPAYRRVELRPDGSIAEELLWVPAKSQEKIA
ncbi:MAG: metallophosphoesterase [Woeseia sp.]